MSKYKKLMRVLLTEIFTNEEPDSELLVDIILRYGLSKKLVKANVSNGEINWELTTKGEKFIRERK